MTITERIIEIRKTVDKINPSAEIVAATKTQDITAIRECMGTGSVVAAGENRVQELIGKYTPEFRWDFIGRLQTNKVKYIIGKVDLIHSLDRLSLAEQIEKECKKTGIKQKVLIEINGGEEENKGGINLNDLDSFLDELSAFSHIDVCGLMAVAPVDYTESQLKKVFDGIYEAYFKRKNPVFKYLSMGMSNDYEIALNCGANIIRPGRVIFGERCYN